MKAEIKRLRAELEACKDDKTLDSLSHTVTFFQSQIAIITGNAPAAQ